ncbi:progesterone receptor isoform X2 [Monodelphis domestica]|uniref:Progesterone receptor n=1 Tax=Monodelphis domestica TaxID=13616 RepID=A0A5F8GJ62_MONDO|nr:progesterone receptor isoform X2 [Monodelphis domestica]
MTELKANDLRTPHVADGVPSPSQLEIPLLDHPDPDPFQPVQNSETSPVVPISLDGLLFPRSRDEEELPDGKGEGEQELPEVDSAYPAVAAGSGRGGGGGRSGSARPPDKDSGLLDSVLDTLLAPPGPGHSHASPPACVATPWCLFGTELPEDPGAALSSQGALPPLMNRLPSKDGEVSGTAASHKVPPGGPPLIRPLLVASPQWPEVAAKPALLPPRDEDGPEDCAGHLSKGRSRALAGGGCAAAMATAPALPPVGDDPPVPREDLRFSAPRPSHSADQEPSTAPGRSPLATSLMDFIHLPILPINPAFLAARTRHLLEVEGYEDSAGAFAQPRDSPASSSTPGAGGDFPDCAFQPDAEPKEDTYPQYGDFQPPTLKIKEEEEGGDGVARSPRSYMVPGSNPASGPDYALGPQLPPQPLPPPPPPRVPTSRPGDLSAISATAPVSASSASSSSSLSSSSSTSATAAAAAAASLSTLECILYKAETAPPQSGPFGPLHCKGPSGAGCLLTRDSLPSTSASATSGPASALYQPLGLNGLPQLGYQAAVLKESLPQVYPPYLNYLRPDTEANQSPQYGFESLPQKICLICGDEASGCHYGVLTCGSCKVFFKRAMEGRKFKKFNKVRVMRALDAVALPQPVGLPNENQALTQRITFSPNQEIQLIHPLINLLMSIEPDVIYAGYDNTKPETSSSLLNSLNQLAERQLLSVVKWSKSLPGFRNLHIDDQITLIQYSWMSLMVFGLGWRSYKHVSGQMLYFAPDLIFNEQRMKESSFYSLCLTMWQIPQEFVKLQVTQEEFLCMKVLLLLNTIPLEGLRSQNQFDEMRSSYIRELIKAIGLRQKGVVASSQRFYQLTRLMDSLHDLVKQLHLYCLNTFIQSRALSVEFPEMMSEVIAAQLPKILAGMVKPLLFHKK